MRVLVVGIVVLLLYSLYLAPISYSKPGWAEIGNWATYRVKINLASVSENITAELVIRVEITSVDNNGFSARGVIVESSVEPEPKAEDLARFIGSIEEGFTEEIYVEYSSTPDTPSFYIDPSMLPPNGVISMEADTTRVEFKYDLETGWLVEGKTIGAIAGKIIVYEMKLVDSNFIGREKSSTRITHTSVLVLATIIAILLFIAVRRKK